MISVSLNGLSLIANAQAVPNFILQTPITGLDAPEYRMNEYSKPGVNGSNVSSQFYDRRTITLTGTIWANNAADYENARTALAASCAIQKDANGSPVPLVLAITTLAGRSYNVNVFASRPIFDYDNVNSTKFLITLNAADPFLYGTSLITSSQLSRPTGGGFILPVILPITSTAATGGSITVANNGAVDVYPLLYFYGPLTNPMVTNRTVGKNMKLNTTLNGGDVIVVDMAGHSITLNGSSSALGSKDSGSDWWPVQIGNNLLSLDTSSGTDTGYAQVSFFQQYLNA